LSELEHEAVLEFEVEITDLDPHQQSRRLVNRWVDGQRHLVRTRLWVTLFTVFGVALLCWLVVSPLHLTGASHLEKASQGSIFTPSSQARNYSVQMLVVDHFIYLLDQDGLVSAKWTRHKYIYLLWQRRIAPSSKLLRVYQNIVYLAAPDGRIVALRASDGAVLWKKRGI
jgi:hypothetical protein